MSASRVTAAGSAHCRKLLALAVPRGLARFCEFCAKKLGANASLRVVNTHTHTAIYGR